MVCLTYTASQVYMSAAVACQKAKQPAAALQLLDDDLKAHGVVPTDKLYNTVISACASMALYEAALLLLDQMWTDSKGPDAYSYSGESSHI
jgi:pentatricopeptide repeat protein